MMKNKNQFNILIVDDEVVLQQVLVMILELEDYVVHSSNSGNNAIKMIKDDSLNIDLVLSDIRMPDGSGTELLKQIKEYNPASPAVILITGDSEFTSEEAIKEGAAYLLTKPINFDTLIAEVELVRARC
jgi:two-component system response regulator HydG